MTEYENFVVKLKELMAYENISANKLSEILEVKHKTVDGWLNGGFFPRAVNLVKLSKHYNYYIDYILNLNDDDSHPEKLKEIDFSRRFQCLLNEKHYKGTEIAAFCKVEPSTVSKWIRRGTTPDTLYLIRLSKFFSCSVEYLIGRVD